jgi:hypothetical protein
MVVTRHLMKILLVLALFALYAWLCRKFYFLFEVDACLDAGGSFDYATGRCIGLPIGDLPPLARRAPFALWLVLLGLPALLVWGLFQVIWRALRYWGSAP